MRLVLLLVLLVDLSWAEYNLTIGGLFVANWNVSYWETRALAAARISMMQFNSTVYDRLNTRFNFLLGDTSPVRSLCRQTDFPTAEFESTRVWIMRQVVESIEALKPSKDVLNAVGPGYSSEVVAINPVLKASSLSTISFSATSPMLSNKTNYPYVARTCPSDVHQGMALAQVLHELELDSFTVIKCNDEYCKGLYEVLNQHAVAAKIDLKTFTIDEQSFTVSDAISILRGILFRSCNEPRVLVLIMHDFAGLLVFEAALAVDAINSKNNFFFIGCEAITSSLSPSQLPLGYLGLRMTIDTYSESFQTLKSIWSKLNPNEYPGIEYLESDAYMSLAYDAVQVMGRAWEHFVEGNYTEYTISNFMNAIKTVQFHGASGWVAFDDNFDPVFARYEIVNLNNESGMTRLAVWESGVFRENFDTNQTISLTKSIFWPPGFVKPDKFQDCVVLSWNHTGDLDLYSFAYFQSGERQICNYLQHLVVDSFSPGSQASIHLAIDNTCGIDPICPCKCGPEMINFKNIDSGIFEIWVNYYSDSGLKHFDPADTPHEPAVVQVFSSDCVNNAGQNASGLIDSMSQSSTTIPTNAPTWWNVGKFVSPGPNGERLSWVTCESECYRVEDPRFKVDIGMMLALNSLDDSEVSSAAKVACQKINDEQILFPGFEISILTQDVTSLQIQLKNNMNLNYEQEALSLLNALTSQNVFKTVVVLGPTGSNESIALSSAFNAGQVLSVSSGAQAAVLSDKSAYPFFSRVVPSDIMQGLAMARTVEHLGFVSCVLLVDSSVRSATMSSKFTERVAVLGVSVIQTLTLSSSDAVRLKASLQQAYQTDFKCGPKVFVLFLDAEISSLVFQAAVDLDLSSRVVWIASSDSLSTSPRPQGLIALKLYSGNAILSSNQSVIYEPSEEFQKFVEYWNTLDPNEYPGLSSMISGANPFLAFTYDAMYLIASTYQLMRSAGYSMNNVSGFVGLLQQVRFQGASGAISLNSNLDETQAIFEMLNLVDSKLQSLALVTASTSSSESVNHLVNSQLTLDLWIKETAVFPENVSFSPCPASQNQGLSTKDILLYIVLPVLSLLVCLFASFFSLWFFYLRRKSHLQSEEERQIHKKIHELRLRLRLHVKDGYLLTGERMPMFSRWKGVRYHTIDKRFLEAAARLSMLHDFDVVHFNGLYSRLSNIAMEFHVENHNAASSDSPFVEDFMEDMLHHGYSIQLLQLRQFILETCEKLLNPENQQLAPAAQPHRRQSSAHDNAQPNMRNTPLESGLIPNGVHKQQAEMTSVCTTVTRISSEDNEISSQESWSVVVKNSAAVMDYDTRFSFFVNKILKIAIWFEDDCALFLQLKEIIQHHMDVLAGFCNVRYESMSSESDGGRLKAFVTETADDVKRQDDPEVLDIR
eukprot:467414-Hanusia_phi.AAC.1